MTIADNYPFPTRVIGCKSGTPAYISGIRVGDIIIAVNKTQIKDSIDFYFHSAEQEFEVEFIRNSKKKTFLISRKENESHGIILEDPKIRMCANDCFFCYEKQMPKNKKFRKGLAVRDDDFRHSFLYGNYVTLTNLSNRDIERIISMRLSPLYVSVHSLQSDIRKLLFGRNVGEIFPLLQKFAENGIELHTQFVIIKSVNDSKFLINDIKKLYQLYPKVKTVSVVPVGLTAYHNVKAVKWETADAEEMLLQILRESEKYPPGFLQAADEWFSITGLFPPPASYYGNFDVIENGVGILRRLLDDIKTIKFPKKIRKKSCLVITGMAPKLFLQKIVSSLNNIKGLDIELKPVVNRTFGELTTVTGLLSWRDIKKIIIDSDKDIVYIPDIMLNSENVFLDGVSINKASRESRKLLCIIPSTAEGFRIIAET